MACTDVPPTVGIPIFNARARSMLVVLVLAEPSLDICRRHWNSNARLAALHLLQLICCQLIFHGDAAGIMQI